MPNHGSPDRAADRPPDLRPTSVKVVLPLLVLLLFAVGFPGARLPFGFVSVLWLAWFLNRPLARFWQRAGWPMRGAIGGLALAGVVYLGMGIRHERRVQQLAREIRNQGTEIVAVEGELWNAHISRVFFGSGAKDSDIDRFTQMEGLDELEMLVLERARVTDDGLNCLGRLPNLRVLSLRETRIGDAGLIHVAKLARLESLDLEGTRVTDDGLHHLEKLPLRSLSVAGSRVTEEGFERASAKLNLLFRD